jgi:hypothetical protein
MEEQQEPGTPMVSPAAITPIQTAAGSTRQQQQQQLCHHYAAAAAAAAAPNKPCAVLRAPVQAAPAAQPATDMYAYSCYVTVTTSHTFLV